MSHLRVVPISTLPFIIMCVFRDERAVLIFQYFFSLNFTQGSDEFCSFQGVETDLLLPLCRIQRIFRYLEKMPEWEKRILGVQPTDRRGIRCTVFPGQGSCPTWNWLVSRWHTWARWWVEEKIGIVLQWFQKCGPLTSSSITWIGILTLSFIKLSGLGQFSVSFWVSVSSAEEHNSSDHCDDLTQFGDVCEAHRKHYLMVTAAFMIFITVNAHRFVYTTSPNWLALLELSPSLSSAPPPPSPKNPVQDLFFSQGHWNLLRSSLLASASFFYFCYSWSLVYHSLCFRKGTWALTCSRSRLE